MAGVAANVTAFNTVVTYDLIQAYFVKDRDAGVLPPRGPDGDDRRDSDLGGHGVHRQGLLEHHELHPDAVLDLQRAALRDLHHRHVLEARHRLGRLLQPRRRHRRGLHVNRLNAYHTIFHFGSPLSASFWQAIIAFLVDAFVMVARVAGHQAKAVRGAQGPVWGTANKDADADIDERDKLWWRSPALLGGVALAILVVLNIVFA